MVVLLQDALVLRLFQKDRMELLIPVEVAAEVLLQVVGKLDKVVQEFYLQKN